MLLTEYEAKQILTNQQLLTPKSVLFSVDEFKDINQTDFLSSFDTSLHFPVYCKAQVLHGNRAQQNLILKAHSVEECFLHLATLFSNTDQFSQPISQVLIEESQEYVSSYYLALRFDTKSRALVALFSQNGGSGMDDRGDTITIVTLSALKQPTSFEPKPELLPTLQKIWKTFCESDATLVEINPLVEVSTTSHSEQILEQNIEEKAAFICLDAKIELEDTARYRHPEWESFPKRSGLGRPPTERENKAHEVSHSDHRGVAGESFFEFEGGEIGVMASGGGASTLAMDALLAVGITPANYTEYSGNPTREKVYKLTQVVTSIPNLRGLYVVGSNANFTDIYDTLAGVVDGLLETDYKPGFIVLIRRGGPRWQEAFGMVEERLSHRGFTLKLFGPDFPLIQTAEEMKLVLEQQQ